MEASRGSSGLNGLRPVSMVMAGWEVPGFFS